MSYEDAILKKFPHLKFDLLQAGMPIKPEEFIKKRLIESLIVSLTLTTSLIFILVRNNSSLLFGILSLPIIYIIAFYFLINTPKSSILKKSREIDSEVIYAGRFLLIQLSAGIPLFNAIESVADNFENIGKHFKEIVKRVDLGKPLEDSIEEVMELTPSDNFRKLLFTITNSLKTGADVSTSLQSIIEQISQEKMIRLKEYGKKLNPMVMFYLIIAVIAPSLGIALMTLLSSFLGISLSLTTLLLISFFVMVVQLAFISVIDTLRRGV